MRMILTIFLPLLLLVSSGANAQDMPKTAIPDGESPAQGEPSSIDMDKGRTYLLCKYKKLVRTVRVEKNPSDGCKTTYTKDGLDQNVGESLDLKICLKVLRNIRINLEKANWKCKDISESRVSTSEP